MLFTPCTYLIIILHHVLNHEINTGNLFEDMPTFDIACYRKRWQHVPYLASGAGGGVWGGRHVPDRLRGVLQPATPHANWQRPQAPATLFWRRQQLHQPHAVHPVRVQYAPQSGQTLVHQGRRQARRTALRHATPCHAFRFTQTGRFCVRCSACSWYCKQSFLARVWHSILHFTMFK